MTTTASSSSWRREGTGELGGLLTAISALDGVIAANMVFEQIEELEGREP